MNTTRLVSLALALAVTTAGPGCDTTDGADSLSCPSDPGPFTLAKSRVSGTVAFESAPTAPLSRGDSVVLRGTAHHEDGLAIREVVIGGVAAELGEFNFATWSATLSYESVVLSGPVSATGDVTVTAFALDACGNRYPFQTLVLPVDPTPNVNITELTLAVAYPGDRSSLPANEGAAATITVTATGRAANARVALHTSGGRFQGLNAAGELTLVADPSADVSTATALFYADAPGTVVLTATAEGKLASALVTAAAAPIIIPGHATLVPGATLDAQVLTAGVLDYCQASPTELFEIRHDGVPIGAAAVKLERNGDDAYVLEVAALETAPQAGSVTLTCKDEYGQAGSARFDLVVANPPPDVVVDALTLVVSVPQDRDHLPADGSASAVLTITGTGAAPANARVLLTASGGTLQGVGEDGGVSLGRSGDGEASATLLFTPDAPGTAVITAHVGGAAFAVATVRVVAAPRLAPGGATLFAGGGLDVVVLTAGEIASCQATPSASFEVTTAAGDPVGAAPVAIGDGPGDQSLRVDAVADAQDGDALTLTCQDVWGQFATASFTAAAP